MARLAAQPRMTRPAPAGESTTSRTSTTSSTASVVEEGSTPGAAGVEPPVTAEPSGRSAVAVPPVTVDREERTPRADSVDRTDAATGHSGSGMRYTLAALAGLAVVALGAAVWAGVVWGLGASTEHDRAAVLAAGRQAAVNLISINYNTADADIQRVKDTSTGDFSALFGQNIDSYAEIVRQGRVISTGNVAEAGVENLDGDRATVLAAVSSKVQNSQNPQGESRNYRMSMDMQYVDGDWKVAKMEFVP